MDFDDAEKSLRTAVGDLDGWSFDRFRAIAPRSESEVVAGASGSSYVFEIDVTDRSGDYDPKDEWLELEFTVSERKRRGLLARRAYVRSGMSLSSGETFSGQVAEITRSTWPPHYAAGVVLAGFVVALGATLLYRCGR